MYESVLYQPEFQCHDVEILTQKTQYQGFVQVESLTLRHRLFADHDFGTVIAREIVRRREAAGVFVYDPILRKFLLIEQFRVGAMNSGDTPWQLEVIAGLIDEGEDALTCVQREALEEAGCTIQNVRLVQTFHTSTGASDERFHLYVATADLSQSGGIHGEVSEGEDIKVHVFNYDDIQPLFERGDLRNSPVIIAMQWFALHLAQQDHF